MLHLTLSPQQKAELVTYLANPLADLPTKRLQIVAMASRGLSVAQIAGYVTLHPLNVRKWLNRYRRDGIEGLRRVVPVGRPRILNAQQRADIAELYASSPRAMGLPFTRWSTTKLRKYLIERGFVKTISVETIRQCVEVHR